MPFGIIGPEFNYIVALFIGIAFGYILEQAGFSTSKKLVGVFYGYDFVVLRVFFTAAATAASGLIILDSAGILDASYLYINPTFLGPAILGGAIMGLGFILGGFCPGTSVVAAAVGKVDAMIFIFGSFIGIFIFGELYPAFEEFYLSGDLGPIFVYDSLGMSEGLFAFLLVMIAMTAFVITDRIEKRVSYGYKPVHPKYKLAVPALVSGAVVALVVLIIPSGEETIADVDTKEYEGEFSYVDVDEAAYDILNDAGKFQFIDLRAEEEYKQYCLTGAVNMNPENVGKIINRPYFTNPVRTPVLYGSDEELAKKAFVLALEEGYNNCRILRGGLDRFKKLIYGDAEAKAASFIGSNTEDFRLRVRKYLESDSTLTKPQEKKKVETKIVKVQGGC